MAKNTICLWYDKDAEAAARFYAATAKRAFDATMGMKKIDAGAIEAARRG